MNHTTPGPEPTGPPAETYQNLVSSIEYFESIGDHGTPREIRRYMAEHGMPAYDSKPDDKETPCNR